MFSVAQGEMFQGKGSRGFQLGVKVPLILNGLLIVGELIRATPSSGNGVEVAGGDGSIGFRKGPLE